MNDLVYDALEQHRPANTRPSQTSNGIRYNFNCPVCVTQGHSADRRKRGNIFLDRNGSCGYHCHNCAFRIRHQPGNKLTHKMELLLRQLGMSDDAIKKLNYDVWAQTIALQQPKLKPAKQPLPSGAKSIKDWLDDNISDKNFNDLLYDLADMNDDIRDSYYWTPNAGTTGDMNRRYIWVMGDPSNPDAWIARAIDDSNPEPIVGNTEAWHAAIQEDQYDDPEV